MTIQEYLMEHGADAPFESDKHCCYCDRVITNEPHFMTDENDRICVDCVPDYITENKTSWEIAKAFDLEETL